MANSSARLRQYYRVSRQLPEVHQTNPGDHVTLLAEPPRAFSLLLCTGKFREVRLFLGKAASGLVTLNTPEVKMI
jgi:hypothetical protein